MLKRVILIFLFIGTLQCVSAAYVDSVYLYYQAQTADSSRIYLVSKVHLGSTSCHLQNVSVINQNDSILTELCYLGGTSLMVCYRTDTIDLGLVKNGVVKVSAIIKEATDSECSSFAYKKDTLSFTINTLPNSILLPDSDGLDISVFPNPVNNKLFISSKRWLGTIQYQIGAATGQQILQNTITPPNYVIDVSTLPPGVYFLQFTDSRQRIVKQFAKE